MENTLKSFCLYKHTSPIGKVYIGITSMNPINRWGLNGQRYKDNTYFKNAILKYGWDNFQHEILFANLSEEKAKHLEIALIRHYKSLGMCYNISAGGDGCSRPTSEETKRKISKSLQGHKSYERTLEWRKRMSEYMKTHPILTKEARVKANIMSARALSKEVVQLNLDLSVVGTYKSIREASRITGFDYSYISKCCRNKYREAYGFLWKFKKDLVLPDETKDHDSGYLHEGTKENIITH